MTKEYRMIYYQFDAHSLEDVIERIRNWATLELPPFLDTLNQEHPGEEWRVISHNICIKEDKGLLTFFVERESK